MKKIFLHIGTFKTGSTALQFHMHQNKRLLLQKDFYYGDYFDNYYLHSNLCYGLLKEALVDYGIFKKYENHPRFLNVAEEPESVVKRIKENSKEYGKIIISCEAFFADAFRTLAGLRVSIPDEENKAVNRFMRMRLRELLSEISEDITIICYLRRQDLFIESQYNQYCKNIWYGDENEELPTFKKFVGYRPVELQYLTVLNEWQAIFRDADFIVRPYEKGVSGYDLITDFYVNVLNIKDLRCFECIEENKANLRLDRDVLEYKRNLKMYNMRMNHLLKEYSVQLPQIRDYAYWEDDERRIFMEQYDGQNRQVAKKFLNPGREYLFEDVNYTFPQYKGLEKERIFEITRWLIDKLNAV